MARRRWCRRELQPPRLEHRINGRRVNGLMEFLKRVRDVKNIFGRDYLFAFWLL